ncbi:MAG: AraC family transcriptional regulator [Salinivirgaceae bacterium]|jgi:AraC family transcriptional regulator|nr:AraC family transcriptional regulator [Salinivirgaceae bacterium]
MTTKTESKKIYISRVNSVMDYIEQNLDTDLSLQTLAGVANFSPFHFHRVFAAFTGETLNQFIKRIKIEKAASKLLNNPDSNLSEISYECGFSSLSVFSRAFRDSYKMSPTQFKELDYDKFSKICKTDSKNGQADANHDQYLSIELLTKKLKVMDVKIEVKELPKYDFIYVRHTGQFNEIGQAYNKLFQWAGPRGLLNFPETKTATVYHDDPKVTDIENVRQSACISISSSVKTDGEIGTMSVPAGKYAVGRFEIGPTEFEEAWNSMCLWLGDSGWQPADGYPYELYHNNHEEHPERKFILDICMPVKPL